MADRHLGLIRPDHFLTEPAHVASQHRSTQHPSSAAWHKASEPLAADWPMAFIHAALDRCFVLRNRLGSGFAEAKPSLEMDSNMKEETAIFPLSAGAELREQAQALAKAAWVMGGPGATELPARPIEEDMDETKTPSD